jgi:hypothetical protein
LDQDGAGLDPDLDPGFIYGGRLAEVLVAALGR